MKQNNNKKIVLSCIASAAPFLILAQDSTSNSTNNVGIDFNWILICIAFILLIPIYMMGNTFLYALKHNLKKNKKESVSGKKVGIIVFLLFLSQFSEAKSFNATNMSGNWLSWLLTVVICIETGIIVFFALQTLKYLKTEEDEKELETAVQKDKSQTLLSRVWDKMNSFRPISEESDIDTGHEYDGIRELNNVTPPWFITAFALTILFAVVYLYRYHISKSAPLPDEEYAIEMAQADSAKAKLLVSQGNNIDENTVTMLGATDIEAGKKIFAVTCVACHSETGGSKPGGVGPNLTDDYWIHSGSIKDIFKSIKYGWPDKGMISWQNNFSAKQMAQLASFVKSLKGSNPPGAKEPQGELYVETNATSTPTIKADSTLKKTN